MYFPIGWPKKADFSLIGDDEKIHQICCDRIKILIAIITDTLLGIWYAKPLIPIVYHRRNKNDGFGINMLLTWKPDSSMIAVSTDQGNIILYSLGEVTTKNGVFHQIDSPLQNLRRDSAELFLKEPIPLLQLNIVGVIPLRIPITAVTCVSLTQMMIAAKNNKIFRLDWDGNEDENFTIDLQKIPYKINHEIPDYCIPVLESNAFTTSLDYSPLVGGFAITFNNGKAAFLTATNLKFYPHEIQGIWAANLEDATYCAINHKFRLLTFGRKNSQVYVYTIDDTTGGLELSHKLTLSPKDFPGLPGPVNMMKWTPDGHAVAVSWENGGISLWSTFGTMLMCSLGWDYGLNVDLSRFNPLIITGMEWSTEGYQLFMLRKHRKQQAAGSDFGTHVLIMDLVKSTLALNPCMASNFHILLQGEDKLYVNQGKNLEKIYFDTKFTKSFQNSTTDSTSSLFNVSISESDDNFEVENSIKFTSMLSESKQWIVVSLPLAYISTNWPIRFTAIDSSGVHLAVAGRTGLAHYSMYTKKWRLFGNETQEKDFIVTGGLLWWNDFIVTGCFNLIERTDELRIYPKSCKLDNRYSRKFQVQCAIILLNSYKDQLIALSSGGKVTIFQLIGNENNKSFADIDYLCEIDIRNICMHPACVVSITMTQNVNNDASSSLKKTNASGTTLGGSSGKEIPFKKDIVPSETIILNVSGRLLMIQHDMKNNTNTSNNFSPTFSPTCLASCVECIWISSSQKSHIKDSLWLYSGAHGMRVWLPIIPCTEDLNSRTYRHTFMSKRIMLSFTLKLYPLVILFEDVIALGIENEAILYTNDSNLHFSLPFSILQKKSQVYLHQILRQLIRRNLGYNAWEIARSCSTLPYFPHSLELLLHEVLEDEATSKEPIPDALLPSVLEFIKEFPVYLQTIVQCARKTEIALWPYLFASAGKPKELFQQCINVKNLETAASYLIILQNLEPSAISRQYATLLLDTALESKRWDLARDLIRFLKAIDPNDVDSPRNSMIIHNKFMSTPPSQHQMNPNPEDLSLILGSSSIARGRSFSTSLTPQTVNTEKVLNLTETTNLQQLQNHQQQHQQQQQQQLRKKSMPSVSNKEKNVSTTAISSSEKFFIDEILQRHGRKLLKEKKIRELGYMSAYLDFHLVSWLIQEDDEALRITDFVTYLNYLHVDLKWPMPNLALPPSTFDSSGTVFNNSSHSKLKVDSGYSSLTFSHKDGITIDCALARTLPCMIEGKENSPSTIEHEGAGIGRGTGTNSFNCMPDSNSVCSTTDDISSMIGDEISLTAIRETQNRKRNRTPQKLEVQIRYLLQIFTEANWLDYSLVLSILLLDAASISRITDTAIRSSSLVAARQLRNALKDITRWSFNEGFGYRAFMLKLQPQISALDQYVIRQEANNINKNIDEIMVGGGGCNNGSGTNNSNLGSKDNLSSNEESHHKKDKINANTIGGIGGFTGSTSNSIRYVNHNQQQHNQHNYHSGQQHHGRVGGGEVGNNGGYHQHHHHQQYSKLHSSQLEKLPEESGGNGAGISGNGTDTLSFDSKNSDSICNLM